MTNTMDNSKAYKKAAREVVPPIYIDNLVMNEVKLSDQIKRLNTPGQRKRHNSGWWSGVYQRAWIGPLAGAFCVSALAIGLGLRANLIGIDGSQDDFAVVQSAAQDEVAAVEPDTAADGVAVEAVARVASTEETTDRSATVESAAVDREVAVIAADSIESGSSSVSAVAIAAVDTRSRQTDLTEASAGADVNAPDSEAQISAAGASGSVAVQTEPRVMAPANAILEADGPRTPEENDLAEQSQPSAPPPVATGVAVDTTVEAQSTPMLSENVDVTALSESQLEDALEQTESRAETLEDTNAELRNRLATLERKVFEAAQPSLITATSTASPETASDRSVVQADAVPTVAPAEDVDITVMAALQALPSKQIRLLLASAENPERYRNPLLAVIGAASRTLEKARAQALIDIYKASFPDAPQPPANFLE